MTPEQCRAVVLSDRVEVLWSLFAFFALWLFVLAMYRRWLHSRALRRVRDAWKVDGHEDS